MGIPTFFRSLLQKNKNIIQGATSDVHVDYFFIDFNSLIYNTWYIVNKEINNQNEDVIHSKLIDFTIQKTCHMVNNIVKPKKYVYISMDGTAPRAKMIQQRSRRYKSVQLKNILKQKLYELENKIEIDWDPSPNISPGTIFMSKLSHQIKLAMKNRLFNCKVYLSDSSIPGEGEHKFLNRLRQLYNQENSKDDSVVIYSPDGDMISLSMMTHKNNIKIMRIPDKKSPYELIYCNDFEFIYCNLDLLRNDFFSELTQTYQSFDEFRILNDYNFLVFMVGNDFVPSMPFLKIRSGGLEILIQIYKCIRPIIKDYLIFYDPITHPSPQINLEFFKLLLFKLSEIESKEMKHQMIQCYKDRNGYVNYHRQQFELDLSPYQLFESRFQHLSFFHPDHPHFHLYSHLLDIIDYNQPKHIWKSQYYKYFFNITNDDQYNNKRTIVVQDYFKSLMFTLKYYLQGCPCFDWHYPHRVSPIPSDMYTVLEKHQFDINNIDFDNHPPYTPFEQLLYILPPQMNFIVPRSIRHIMSDPDKYPKEFEIDALAGIKYIYSEAILPELEMSEISSKMKNCKFSKNEEIRNKNFYKLITTIH